MAKRKAPPAPSSRTRRKATDALAESSSSTLALDRLPQSLLEIPDDTLRWKATKAWEAAPERRDCIAEWRVWLGRLESEERVGCLAAIWLHDRTCRAANTLCGKRVIHPDITPMGIVSRFPDPPGNRPGWASRYDIPRAKAKLSMLDRDGFEDQLRAIRIHIETWPEYLQADDAPPAQAGGGWGKGEGVKDDQGDSKPNGKKKGHNRKKRGRKRLEKKEVERREAILTDWAKARSIGVAFRFFAATTTRLTVKEMERYVAWKAARNRRKREN